MTESSLPKPFDMYGSAFTRWRNGHGRAGVGICVGEEPLGMATPKAAKRELFEPHANDKRFIRRNDKGRMDESVMSDAGLPEMCARTPNGRPQRPG
jgi:hypothetical protein